MATRIVAPSRRATVGLRRPSLSLARRVAREIAKSFSPERVILFGSTNSGQPGPDSDLDLLVVFKGRRPPVSAGQIRSSLPFPVAMDILVRTEEELRKRLRLGDVFFREIVANGRVLHEAVHAGVGR
ncbi:MAG TPA: nucleotidyltransferase domain-containing protein [Thermoplasmata archaeon]|nr:nucleotidyltransferase domain-containing protein [Thermoplasmata archaeon]